MGKYLLTAMLSTILVGCTLSLQNIDTHGTATDLVDENQAASPTVTPTLTIPVTATPPVPIITPMLTK